MRFLHSASILVLASFTLAAHANLLADGGFEASGNATISPLSAAWSSDLPYFIDAPNRYDVLNGVTPNSINSGWRSDLLAKEGTHNLLVDGPTSAGQTVLASAQTIPVAAGESYALSAYLAAVDVNPEPIPILTFTVSFLDSSGNLVNEAQSQFSPPSIAAGWQLVSLSALAGGGATQARISIGDINTSAFGNDFALDGLAFQPVPEPTTVAALGVGAVAMLRRRKRD